MTKRSAINTLTIDPLHTIVEYHVRHMGISNFRGKFGKVEGTIVLDEENPSNSSVKATIAAASFDLPDGRFYRRISGQEFLDAEQYPWITFHSTSVEQADADRWTVVGDLTLRGVTREVALDTTYLGQEKDPFTARTVAAFSASGEIDRRDFGLNWNTPLESGAAYLGEKVRLALQIETVRQD